MVLHCRRHQSLLIVAIMLSAALSAVIALPILPARDLRGSLVMALNPAQGETVGWPRFVQTVSDAWRKMPPAVRQHTAIVTRNYGEAGAIDLSRQTLRLPRVQRPQRVQRMGPRCRDPPMPSGPRHKDDRDGPRVRRYHLK